MYCFLSFSIVHYLQYCVLEDSSTKCEMCDMHICVRGMHGKTLVGRDHMGTEILMTPSQPMKTTQLWKTSQSENFAVLCVL